MLADGSTLDLAVRGHLPAGIAINSVWVLVAGILVMFMQAGFAFLEIGFSRGKNAGTVVAKILVNFAIAGLVFYAVGFAFSFGSGNSIIGTHGFFLAGSDAAADFPLAYSGRGSSGHVTVETLWFFQFVFCAVSLAIVWGTTLERIKFGVYVIYS
ncbi:MAG TPA: ammonium transporter, partial [Solirubrobacteraceae bacterium]